MEPLTLSIEHDSPPCQGQHYDCASSKIDACAYAMVELQPSELAQDIRPIVIARSIVAGDTAKEHDLTSAGISDIGSKVHHTLPEPP